MDQQVLEIIKGIPNILGMIYQDVAQPSVKAVGDALGTVFEYSTSFLLPLKLRNEKVKLNFTKRLNEYKEKLEAIPEEKRCEVHPEIGTPIIEKLSYTTSDEIADLFTTLLADASNVDLSYIVHPAFITMIERISPDETKIIKYLDDKTDILFCRFNGIVKMENTYGKGFITLEKCVTLLPYRIHFIYPQNVEVYLSNLVCLGILNERHGQYKDDEDSYNSIVQKSDYEKLVTENVPNEFLKIEIEKGFYEVTEFGRLFIKACLGKK